MRRMPRNELHPMHHSRARNFVVLRPLNMEQMSITTDQAEALDDICLGVFADMSNAGATLSETLRAIYMTGVQNALSIVGEQRKESHAHS